MNTGRVSQVRRLLAAEAAGLLLALALAGCTGMVPALSGGPVAKAHPGRTHAAKAHPAKAHAAKAHPAKARTVAKRRAAASRKTAAGPGTLRLLIEPAAGVGAIDKLITGPGRRST